VTLLNLPVACMKLSNNCIFLSHGKFLSHIWCLYFHMMAYRGFGTIKYTNTSDANIFIYFIITSLSLYKNCPQSVVHDITIQQNVWIQWYACRIAYLVGETKWITLIWSEFAKSEMFLDIFADALTHSFWNCSIPTI